MVGTTQTHEDLGVWSRLLRTGCIAVPVAPAVLVVVAISGVGGYRGGWLWAPVVAAPPMAAVGWGGWGRARGRLAVTAVFALSGIAFGAWASQESDLSHPRLRAAMDSITAPANFEHTGDSAAGASVCFDECPSLTRFWVVTGDVDDAMAQLRRMLQVEGFVLGDWDTATRMDAAARARGHRGRLGVDARVGELWVWKDGKAVHPSPGQVGLSVTLDTYVAY